MNGDDCRKKEKLRRRQASSAEQRLNKRMKAVIGGVRGADGKPPSRAIARIIYDEQMPAGMIGRRFVEMRKKRTPLKSAEEVLEELRDWLVNDLYANTSKDSTDNVA